MRLAEQWVEAALETPGDDPVGLLVEHPDQWRRLPNAVRIHRAGLALMAGDVAATMDHGREALAVATDDDDLGHGAATALIGLAAWRLGDLETAEAAYAETMRRFERGGYIADILGCAVTLADIQLTRGRLRDAERTYRDSLDLAERQPSGPLRGMPDMHVGLSLVATEHDDLLTAREHLRVSHELGDHLGLPKHPHRWRIAEARILEAEGDLAGALALLDEAERVYDGDFSPDVQPVTAMRARIWVKQGRPEDVLSWAADRGLSTSDELTYLREYEHITLAQALLASRDAAATPFLERLLAAAEAGGRLGSVREIRVLLAPAQQRHGAAVPPRGPDALVDPLSDRELDVLRLLASELNGPEIARHLVVSLNTVRTHTKNIYAKLGVGSRRAAVRRGEELGLLRR